VAKSRDFKAEYARRIARNLEKGKTRQQARGHKPREHIERREREVEELGIARDQDRRIRDWCRRYKNETRDEDEVVEMAISKGYNWFKTYRDTWNAARREYLRALKDGSYASKGLTYLEMLASMSEVEEISWLYYH